MRCQLVCEMKIVDGNDDDYDDDNDDDGDVYDVDDIHVYVYVVKFCHFAMQSMFLRHSIYVSSQVLSLSLMI